MLSIDPSSDLPPYEQLRRQVEEQVRTGVLVPGTRLPAVRRLAADLGLAPGTVARAYRELEHSGHVVTAGRRGTIVATPSEDDADVRAAELAGEYVRAVRGLGLGPDATLTHIHRALANLR